MLRSKQRFKGRPIVAALFVFSLTCPAAAAPRPYHLQLEAQPAAVLPYLAKFGRIKLDVYLSGVRGETIWLNGFSRNGADTITVENPFGRMYTDVPLSQISSLLAKLGMSGPLGQESTPGRVVLSKGKVAGIVATRHRLEYGPTAWIDVWTTSAIPENPQFRRIVNDLVSAISPDTGRFFRSIPGTPIFVEVNFRRFKRVVLVRTKKLTLDNKGEEDALKVGSFYFKAPLLDAIWR
jgi:hypothetical protein